MGILGVSFSPQHSGVGVNAMFLYFSITDNQLCALTHLVGRKFNYSCWGWGWRSSLGLGKTHLELWGMVG